VPAASSGRARIRHGASRGRKLRALWLDAGMVRGARGISKEGCGGRRGGRGSGGCGFRMGTTKIFIFGQDLGCGNGKGKKELPYHMR